MLSELQSKFATCCRTGEMESFADVEQRRLQIYRNSVFNQIVRILIKAYPLTRRALGERWDQLTVEFFANHQCASPHLWQMPKGLYEYVKKNGTQIPWLIDLLHFEWIEIAVHMAPDVSAAFVAEGDLTADRVVVNPEHSLDRFTYPVFREKPDRLEAGAFFLLTFRRPVVLDVHFIELSSLFAVAVSALTAQPMTVPEVLELTCQQLKLPFDAHVCQKGIQVFEELLNRGAVLGYEKGDDRCAHL